MDPNLRCLHSGLSSIVGKVNIQPTGLFSRLLALVERSESSIEDQFDYELTQEPTLEYRINGGGGGGAPNSEKLLSVGEGGINGGGGVRFNIEYPNTRGVPNMRGGSSMGVQIYNKMGLNWMWCVRVGGVYVVIY